MKEGAGCVIAFIIAVAIVLFIVAQFVPGLTQMHIL